MLTLLAAVALTGAPAAPLERQCLDALRQAQRNVVTGKRGRALAELDSLVMSDGVTVSLEATGTMEASVYRGLDAWNASLGERPFRMLVAGSPADVTVRFVSSLDSVGGDVQGMVTATRQMSWSNRDHAYKLHGVIYVRDNVEGRPLRPEEVVNVVAHEAGHLLGLADVRRHDRLMGPMVVNHPRSGPEPEEIAAVQDYRTLVRQSYPQTSR